MSSPRTAVAPAASASARAARWASVRASGPSSALIARTAATARALREARCDGFQGSHVAPAMDAAALAGWLAAERARADGVARR